MNPERKVKFPLKAKVAAAVSVSTAALLSACGGGEKEAAVQNPSSTIEPTASSVSYTPEPTPVITESPTPTPEPTPVPIPEVDRIAIIEKVIDAIENGPIPQGASFETWEIAKLDILDGVDDPAGMYGLRDVQVAISQGDLIAANTMLTPDLFHKVVAAVGVDEPTKVINKEQIDQLDPQRLLIDKAMVFYGMSEERSFLAQDLITLKYSLQQ